MTPYEPGDVVLVRFPFTDLASSKKRPAVVLNPPQYSEAHADVVILALTSRVQTDDALALEQWQEAGLPKKTWAKPVIGTVAGTLIERKVGSLRLRDHACVKAAIRLLMDPRFLS